MNPVKGVDSGEPTADSGYPESQQGPTTTLHLSPQNTDVIHIYISLSFTHPHPPPFPSLSLFYFPISLFLSLTSSLHTIHHLFFKTHSNRVLPHNIKHQNTKIKITQKDSQARDRESSFLSFQWSPFHKSQCVYIYKAYTYMYLRSRYRMI